MASPFSGAERLRLRSPGARPGVTPVGWRRPSHEFLELFDAETRIGRDATHRESVYGIVARNRHDAHAIGHDDVFALAQDLKASLFQSLHAIEMIDAENL